jgi:uncharacterized protein (TIGR02145 family)
MTNGEKLVKINGNPPAPTDEDKYKVWYTSYNFPILQNLTPSTCQDLPLRLNGDEDADQNKTTIFRDSRDSQLYHVAQLADEKCWMLDNLKYRPNGDTTGTNQLGFSATQIWSGSMASTSTGQYVDPIASIQGSNYCRGSINSAAMSPNTITKCGFLYNWTASTAGSGDNLSSDGDTAPNSICPTNWRLPTAYTKDNGVTNADFAILNASMYDKSLASSGSTTSRPDGWQPAGAFRGVFSGSWDSNFLVHGSYGNFWSSSVGTSDGARRLSFLSSFVYQYNTDVRYRGFGVRCVIGS